MFEEGGVPAGKSAEPPRQEYDLEAAAALAKRYGVRGRRTAAP